MTWAASDPGGAEAGYVAQIRADAAAIATILLDHGPEAPVAACPGWGVGDVVGHLGDVHRWATEIVRTGEAVDREEHPPEAAQLRSWFTAGADALCQALEDTDPERPCWTFGFPPARTGFWRRRQAFETSVHHFDVAHATDTSFDLAPAMAARGVTEVVTFTYPRQVALERTPGLAQAVRLRATDAGDAWTLGSSVEPRAEIAGPAVALLLMLWGRAHEPLARSGDAAALAAFDATAITP